MFRPAQRYDSGGQIPLGDRCADREVLLLSQRALQHLRIPLEGAGEPLI
jgi:hypothetical protein